MDEQAKGSVDERLVRAARHVSSQLNASVALEMVWDLTQLLRWKPRQAEAHYFLGVAYDCLANRRVGWEWRRRRQARDHYRKALAELHAGSYFATAANYGLAANLAWEGKYGEVQQLLSKSLQSPEAVMRMRAEIVLGVAAFRGRRWDTALKHWQAAYALTPEDISNYDAGLPGSWLHWGYRELAQRYLRQRQPDKAYNYSSQLVSLDGMFLTAQDFKLHATICEQTRRREEALDALDSCLAMSVDDGAEGPATHMGDRPSFMPSWGYAYDRLVDGSGSFESDMEK